VPSKANPNGNILKKDLSLLTVLEVTIVVGSSVIIISFVFFELLFFSKHEE
jgi:hypothetical protein